MTPLLPALTLKFHLSTSIIGMFIAVSALSSSILQPLYGSLMDRFPKINFALIGLVMCSLIALIGNVDNLAVLMGIIFLSYMGNGMYHPFTITQTAQLAEAKQKNARMGLFFSIGTLGFAFGPFLSSQLVERGGLPNTVLSLVILLVGIPVLWNIQKNASKKAARLSPITAASAANLQHKNKAWWPFKIKETQLLSLLCVIGFVRFFGIIGLQTYMPFIWTKAGYSLSTIGLVLGGSTLMGVPMVIYTGKLADKVGEKWLHIFSIIPAFILSILLFKTSGHNSFLIFIALIATLFASQATNVVIAMRYIKHSHNLVSGILNGITIGAAGIGMPIVGWMGDRIGLAETFQTLLPPIIILGIISSLLLPSPKRFRKPFSTLFNKKPALN